MPFDLIRAAGALIAAPSSADRGNLAVVPVVSQLAEQVGLSLEVLPGLTPGGRDANLLVGLPGGSEREPLLLLTHTDTVEPGPLERWTITAPLTAKVDGDRLYGLGSADVKVDLCAKLLALERHKGKPLRRGVFVLGTYGEEVGLLGAKAFVKSGRLRPRAVVCGEPSELRIVHAHKGYLVARVRLGEERAVSGGPSRQRSFQGKAAHSSTPALGENAIEKALADPLLGAVSLRGGQGANSVPSSCEVELGDGPATLPLESMRKAVAAWHSLVSALRPDSDGRFAPASTVSNLGWARAENGRAELLLDARLLPGHDPAGLAATFGEAVRALGGSVSFERENPAVWTDPAGDLVQAARRVSQALDLNDAPQTKATNTEAAAFAGLCEAIVFGPGISSGNAHCANEFTLLPQVARAIDWYDRLITELCG
jgi:acetylornithine deacetylase/succinyl-diaminopimelate desuccinylase-like protein